MPRDWNGYVFKTTGRKHWSAKWKEWGTEAWRVSRGFESKSMASDFLTEKRREYRARARGDWDEFTVSRKQPIKEHVDAFHAHVLANRRRRTGARSEKHANQSKARLLAACTQMKVRTIGDLTGDRVEAFLSRLLDANSAMKTRNDYCAVLKQFTRWAVAAERLARDPLGNLRFLDATADMERKQTLTWEQVRDLAAAGVQRVTQQAQGKVRESSMEFARRRGLTIVTMFLTGLRNGELAALRWDWIDQAAKVITVPYTVTKSGHTEYIPLHEGLGQLLEQERARRAQMAGRPLPGSDLVVGAVVNGEPKLPRWIVNQVRDDAEWIKMPAVDDRGRVLVLYSMRGSFGTQLDALGVPPSVVSSLMRHRAGTVTMEHYVQRANSMLLDAINKIPAEAAHVPGLFLVPSRDPRATNTSEHQRTPTTIGRAQ